MPFFVNEKHEAMNGDCLMLNVIVVVVLNIIVVVVLNIIVVVVLNIIVVIMLNIIIVNVTTIQFSSSIYSPVFSTKSQTIDSTSFT